MAQNIYDRLDFFEGYSQLRRSVQGLAGAPEWPALRSMLPDIRDSRVVDLGCGFGWFCRWAREQGAAQVLGIDVSERMLDRAQETTTDKGITYQKSNLEAVSLPSTAFELAYSSLAVHYIEDVTSFFAMIYNALVPGGRFIFSTEHPIYMAPTKPGWSVDAAGRRTWPLDSYLVEGRRTTDWFTRGVVKHHRTISTTLNALIKCGFSISRVEEFRPTTEQIAAMPELAHELDRPMFLLISTCR